MGFLDSSTDSNSDRDTCFDGGEVNTLPAQAEAAESQRNSVQVEEQRERVYYADWLRACAIFLVIFVHCLCNSFDASGLDPDENPTI
jgi:hypothetical protein